MKVSINWLRELVNLKMPVEEIIQLLPLRTIAVKEVTPEYFELDMKGYNRADLLSMRGVAYEIAAITNSEVNFKEQSDYIWKNLELPRVETEVLNSKLASVYCLAKIDGLKVDKSSPEWLKKLNDSGMRSVNNIADVTNLVMLEYGQPLHSFDAGAVKDETIIVRTAKIDEEIVTLDNKRRKLETTDLLITDPEKALGIAGVMGGKNSEVSESTTTILLEAAIFDPVNLRSTATRLGLQSEASKRFQHGLTKQRCLQALDAAIKMYQELGGKLTGITLIGDLTDKIKTIKLTQEKVNSLIGVEIPSSEIESSLTKLGFKLASHLTSGNADWEVTPPYFRLDVNIEEDVIEEVARMYGYEKIPAKELVGELPKKIDQSLFDTIYKLKTTLANLGLTEIQTYSFYSTAVISNCFSNCLRQNKFQISNLLKLLNPMSAETEYLRDNLWPNLLEATAKNIRNGIKDVAIFELGKVYFPQSEDMPKETYHLAIALSNGTDNPIQELSAIANSLFPIIASSSSVIASEAKQSSPKIEIATGRTVWCIPRNDNNSLFHPTRFAALEKDGQQIGYMAEIHQRFVDKFGINQRVAILEITL